MRSRSSRYPRGAVAPVWLYVGLAFSSFILSSCAGQRPAARDAYDSPGPCATRYPVVLVHGIALRSDNGLAPYFPGIQERLEAGGCRVAVADVDAWGTIEANAAQLVSAVREACLDFGADKVNIIAHSKGGLDARYAISVLGLADSVASLTTLATPHRGSFWAGFLLSEARWPKELAGSLADAFGTLAGDERARALEAGSQLSIEAMEAFNAAVPDAPGVLYQSYAGVVAPGHPNPLWLALAEALAEEEGPNDSAVSLGSAEWGDFRGVVGEGEPGGVGHLDMTFRQRPIAGGEFCAPEFFAGIVAELKERSF